MKKYAVSCLIVVLAWAGASPSAEWPPAPSVRVLSPDGRVRMEVGLRPDATPHYRVFLADKPIILSSRLAIDLAEGTPIGGPSIVDGVETRSRRAEYDVVPGKRRHVVDHCTEAVFSFRESAAPGRRWELVVRAYNDGVAFRYRFPAQDGWRDLVIAGERTEFALPADARAFALPLNGFTTSYEKYYQKKPVAEIPQDWLLGLPLLVECPGSGWAAITEANLTDYAGMYLAHANGGGVLTSRLSPLPKEPKVAVRAVLPHASPWRVVLLGTDAARLIESDLILHLNEPCTQKDISWIKPGKTTFPWWNGFHLEKVSFKPGLNTATMKHYIDFCAEAGIPYHSLDGIDNIAWYGGSIVPYEGSKSITEGLPGLDLQEVIRHANAKGVRLRMWMHWEAAKAHMDKAFPLYRKWGIEGVMLDFMDRDDQEMNQFLRDVLKKAAENHLTVTLHGMSKPTGLERTFPHLLNSEGVLNLEYNKWDTIGCPPEHEVTVPFTRMLAGPLDFHQGSFRGVSVEEFKPRNAAPLVMGTPSRTLASYVVFQNHLPMAADYPSAYRGHPALPMLAKIPATWDDTKVVSGTVGEYIVVARRRGADWYVGAMNDRKQRDLDVPLRFLGPGTYRAEIFADDLVGKPARGLALSTSEVEAGDTIKARLESAGGCMMKLTPIPGKGSGSRK